MSAIANKKIDEQILTIDKVICRHIDNLNSLGRGAVSQDILAQLRNFVEHIMLKIYANGQDIVDKYDNIEKAVNYVKTKGNLKFLRRFHAFLQIVASHYSLDEESSERLMLKYYEYLIKTKDYMKTYYSIDILANLDKFPINTDPKLAEYYGKIAVKIKRHEPFRSHYQYNDRYYIQKVKPFFLNQKIYYEVTFTRANSKISKFDRFIAFTDLEISQNYAAKLYIANDSITILDKVMPIHIIVKWETSIRPCEINNFSAILGANLNERGGLRSTMG